jgi:hypothetical protein
MTSAAHETLDMSTPSIKAVRWGKKPRENRNAVHREKYRAKHRTKHREQALEKTSNRGMQLPI